MNVKDLLPQPPWNGPPWPRSLIPEPHQRKLRRELRKEPTWKLQQGYDLLQVEKPTGVKVIEQNRAYALSAIREILFERGK